jgi:hypothetical protein
MEAGIVCPHCYEQSPLSFPHEGWLRGECPKCKKSISTLLATIRAKRSRGNKRLGTREFDVRVRHNGREEMISFLSMDYEDIELRSSDFAAFNFVDKRLAVVQNLAIGQHWIIRKFGEGLGTWLIIILLVIVGAVLVGSFVVH